jgi:hypothetical protein
MASAPIAAGISNLLVAALEIWAPILRSLDRRRQAANFTATPRIEEAVERDRSGLVGSNPQRLASAVMVMWQPAPTASRRSEQIGQWPVTRPEAGRVPRSAARLRASALFVLRTGTAPLDAAARERNDHCVERLGGKQQRLRGAAFQIDGAACSAAFRRARSP